MATEAGDDREIFESGHQIEDHNADDHGAGDQPLIQTRTAEDLAVSDAIRQIGRGVQPAIPPAPQQRQPAPQAGAQPTGDQPGADGIEDRSTAGLLRALLDERERRQGLEAQNRRYSEQDAERRRTEEANRSPLHERLFSEPDTAIAELTQQITGPLEQRIEQMRVQHDFALASVRHAQDNVFADAWAAWFQKVGTGQDPDTYHRIMKAPSPGEALVQWFKGEQRNSTIGDDLNAYNAKVIREHYESLGQPVPPQFAAPGGQQAQPEQRFDARAGQPARDASGRFVPSQPQAQRLPTATSRMGQSGGGLSEHDEDGSDAAIFDSGRPERGKAR